MDARLPKDASNPARWVRAARNCRRISQRELAEISGVPHATIERIESSRSSPRVATLETLLQATGFEIVIQDSRERELAIDEEREGLIDRGGRRFPAHLTSSRVCRHFELAKPGYAYSWGWNHIAWPYNGHVWEDAT